MRSRGGACDMSVTYEKGEEGSRIDVDCESESRAVYDNDCGFLVCDSNSGFLVCDGASEICMAPGADTGPGEMGENGDCEAAYAAACDTSGTGERGENGDRSGAATAGDSGENWSPKAPPGDVNKWAPDIPSRLMLSLVSGETAGTTSLSSSPTPAGVKGVRGSAKSHAPSGRRRAMRISSPGRWPTRRWWLASL